MPGTCCHTINQLTTPRWGFEELGLSPSTGLGTDLLHRRLLVSDSLTLEDLTSGIGFATGQVSSGQL